LPSEKLARRLEDITDNVQAIQRYIAGMDLDAFEKDSKTYDAVERCLERSSEAAAKLGDPGFVFDAGSTLAKNTRARKPLAPRVRCD
jgi:hypothetical protein